MGDDEQFTVFVQRDHFSFPVRITISKNSAFYSYTFEIGSTSKPCLKLYVRLAIIDERFIEASKTASLLNLEALTECVEDDINENYMRKHRLGIELLDTVEYIIKKFFPHVKHISLNDKSYMPCNRAFDDRLDLATYSIALYGKTWYEKTCNAYLPDVNEQKQYREEIAKYMSPEFKSSFDADTFLVDKIMLSPNVFAQEILKTKYSEIKDFFIKAKTLPEFFQSLRDVLPEKQKCKFFRDWLEVFISKCITIRRTWQYDITRTSYSRVKKRRSRRARWAKI